MGCDEGVDGATIAEGARFPGASVVAQEVEAGHLVALSVAGSPPTQEFGVVRLSGRTLPAVVGSLVEAIVAADRAGADLDRVPDLRAAPREPAR